MVRPRIARCEHSPQCSVRRQMQESSAQLGRGTQHANNILITIINQAMHLYLYSTCRTKDAIWNDSECTKRACVSICGHH